MKATLEITDIEQEDGTPGVDIQWDFDPPINTQTEQTECYHAVCEILSILDRTAERTQQRDGN